MNNKLFFVLALMLFLLPFAYADLGNYKQNSCINIIQTCSNCTYSNITIILYPDSTTALGEVAMQEIGVLYNYTFCSTTLNGVYNVYGTNDNNAITSSWKDSFIVTPNHSGIHST
jgi:hypothetical protein